MKKLLVFLCVVLLFFLTSQLPQAYADLINLSFNTSTTATTNNVYLIYGPDKALDGDKDHYSLWNADKRGTAENPLWLVVDLGDSYKVDHIELWSHDGPGYSWYYIDYTLYSSLDGEMFNALANGTLTDPATINPPTQEYYDYFHDTITVSTEMSIMRFVKFEVAGGTHWAHLNEIEIWGESTPVPEPTTMFLLGSGLIGLAGFRKRSKRL